VHDSLFRTSSAKKLALNQTRVVTVTGKAFFHVGYSPKDQKSNRRSHLPGYAAWEIHPAMKIAVNGPSLLCRVGPVAFFMKPFDDEKFIAAVRDALNQSLIRK
jgi:hypothetical protein